MKISKWTIGIIALIASFGMSSCQLLDWGEDLGALETVVVNETPRLDPETGEPVLNEEGQPIVDQETVTQIAGPVANVVRNSFGDWGTLALALAGGVLALFTKRTRSVAKASKQEAEENKAAALALMRAGRSSDSTEGIKKQLRELPYNDPARKRVRELAPLA